MISKYRVRYNGTLCIKGKAKIQTASYDIHFVLGDLTRTMLCNRKLYKVKKGEYLRLNCWISAELFKLIEIVKVVKLNENRMEMVFST